MWRFRMHLWAKKRTGSLYDALVGHTTFGQILYDDAVLFVANKKAKLKEQQAAVQLETEMAAVSTLVDETSSGFGRDGAVENDKVSELEAQVVLVANKTAMVQDTAKKESLQLSLGQIGCKIHQSVASLMNQVLINCVRRCAEKGSFPAVPAVMKVALPIFLKHLDQLLPHIMDFTLTVERSITTGRHVASVATLKVYFTNMFGLVEAMRGFFLTSLELGPNHQEKIKDFIMPFTAPEIGSFCKDYLEDQNIFNDEMLIIKQAKLALHKTDTANTFAGMPKVQQDAILQWHSPTVEALIAGAGYVMENCDNTVLHVLDSYYSSLISVDMVQLFDHIKVLDLSNLTDGIPDTVSLAANHLPKRDLEATAKKLCLAIPGRLEGARIVRRKSYECDMAKFTCKAIDQTVNTTQAESMERPFRSLEEALKMSNEIRKIDGDAAVEVTGAVNAFSEIFELITLEFFKRVNAAGIKLLQALPKEWSRKVKEKDVKYIRRCMLKIDKFNAVSMSLGALARLWTIFCNEIKLIQLAPCRSEQAWLNQTKVVEGTLQKVQHYTITVQACNLILNKWPKQADMEERQTDYQESHLHFSIFLSVDTDAFRSSRTRKPSSFSFWG